MFFMAIVLNERNNYFLNHPLIFNKLMDKVAFVFIFSSMMGNINKT